MRILSVIRTSFALDATGHLFKQNTMQDTYLGCVRAKADAILSEAEKQPEGASENERSMQIRLDRTTYLPVTYKHQHSNGLHPHLFAKWCSGLSPLKASFVCTSRAKSD